MHCWIQADLLTTEFNVQDYAVMESGITPN
jgi:hypothetical protein